MISQLQHKFFFFWGICFEGFIFMILVTYFQENFIWKTSVLNQNYNIIQWKTSSIQ